MKITKNESMDPSKDYIQDMIIVPTRVLALQTSQIALELSKRREIVAGSKVSLL